METVKVRTQKPYEVTIAPGLLTHLGEFLKTHAKGDMAVVISDSNVFPHYGQICQKLLTDAGFKVSFFVLPAGEEAKSLTHYGALLEFLSAEKVSRADSLIALGGGVVGDITGFVAATYLRGVAFGQVPTSLLAAVDSSVGGKTALNLAGGKNLVGAFYQPSFVLCDPELLATLPLLNFQDGLAEIIKYGVIMKRDFYDGLAAEDFSGQSLLKNAAYWAEIIATCVRCKEELVAQDEYDQGSRQLLNFGHTLGHAIEILSDYSISHGLAVAMGMAQMAKISARQGWCSSADYHHLRNFLQQAGFELTIPYAANELFEAVLQDKKRESSTITLVTLASLGQCVLTKIPLAQFNYMLIYSVAE